MNSKKVLDQLRKYESPNVTWLEADGSWPIVWDRARGAEVWDAEGRKYLDLTAAFGVAACGHANPRVVSAGQGQMRKLLHAMGDVHPHALKARLARELSRVTFERWAGTTCCSAKTIFCNSGFEAVEAALKTAVLATGKSGVIAFEGAYHGLGYGALNATHRQWFRKPFEDQLGKFAQFVPFPRQDDGEEALELTLSALRRACKRMPVGAILVEPVQARGGINIPPPGFLPLLREFADEQKIALILDEIYTGFCRTGKWFACEHSRVTPDLICLGKALTGGFPLSACVGRADFMDAAWPRSTGEAIHTSTFLGHPVGCAMALAQLDELRRRRLAQRAAFMGRWLLEALRELASRRDGLAARGIGLLAGIELTNPGGEPATARAMCILKGMLQKGVIMLPEGEHGNILSFSPPLTITRAQLQNALNALSAEIDLFFHQERD
jgi:4-aminobutyrate aminotransferase-like enzyme